MGMTEEERFRFDLTGFLVRPAILTPDEVAAIVDQADRIRHNPKSLPPEHRAIPGGAASLLIDHPKVIEVLHEIIGPDVRLEACGLTWRLKGESHGELHGGARGQADPIFGYRVQNGRIHAGMVRVVFELTDVKKEDGATCFIVGSHKSKLPDAPGSYVVGGWKRERVFGALRMSGWQCHLFHGEPLSCGTGMEARYTAYCYSPRLRPSCYALASIDDST